MAAFVCALLTALLVVGGVLAAVLLAFLVIAHAVREIFGGNL